MGYTIPHLRASRHACTGAEVGFPQSDSTAAIETFAALGSIHRLPNNWQRIATRYATDLHSTVKSCFRTLRRGGMCHFVVGDSMLRGVRIFNSRALIQAAELCGFEIASRQLRRIPSRNRYLPAG